GLIPLGDEHTETIEVRPESSIHRLASGTRIGRYIIIGGISPVGLGESYAAFDPELDCKVILKLIGVGGTHEEPAQEAEALLESLSQCAGIDHPSVCKIHATGSYGDGVFVAMEFVEGINLRQW